MLACFVPEREFHAVPKPQLIVDSAQVVLHGKLSRAHGLCDFTVLESLGNKLDYSEFSFAGRATTVQNCLP